MKTGNEPSNWALLTATASAFVLATVVAQNLAGTINQRLDQLNERLGTVRADQQKVAIAQIAVNKRLMETWAWISEQAQKGKLNVVLPNKEAAPDGGPGSAPGQPGVVAAPSGQ